MNAADLLAAYAKGMRAFRDLDLSRIELRGAALGDVDFQDTRLVHADLRDADLAHANLRGTLLWGSDLRGASLDDAVLRGADFSGAFMEGIDLRHSLAAGVNLSFCHLVGAILSGLDLKRVRLYGAQLIRARLDGANLERAELRTANLEAADLTGANLSAADLETANLERAVLSHAVLDGSQLRSVNLRRADLRGASLVNANLEDAELEGASLDGANLQGAYTNGLRVEADALMRTVGEPSRHAAPAQVAIVMRGVVPEGGKRFLPKKVFLGASAPRQSTAGGQFTARFVVNAEGLEDKVRGILNGLSPSSSHHLGAGKTYWAKDAEVQVVLNVLGLEVERPVQSFLWDGEYQIVDFDVRVPGDAQLGNTILSFDAFVGDVPAGTVRLELAIARARSDERNFATQRAFTTGFASYASDDRLRVLDRVGAMRQLTGVDVFLDCISLRAGERWEERLYEEIEGRDLFFLFWSRSACRSEWVTREWKTAMRIKGEQAMQIQPLDPPSEAPPPAELQHLHFNDLLTLVRAGFARQRKNS